MRIFGLYTGEFATQDGCLIRVDISKIYDLRASPGDLSFDVAGGKAQVTIWSTKGKAKLSNNHPGWLSATLVGTEPVPGTQWDKYIYDINCYQNNSGDLRTFAWEISIEEGEGAGIATSTFSIRQVAESTGGVLTVYPAVINADAIGISTIITLNYVGGTVVPSINYPGIVGDWVNLSILDYPETGVVRYNVDISKNTGGERSVEISFTSPYGTATTSIYQAENTNPEDTTISVLPTSMSFPEGGGTEMATVTYTGVEPSYSFYGGSWLTASVYDYPQSGKVRYSVSVSPNSAGTQRFGTLTFSDLTGGYADIYVSQIGSVRYLEAIPSEQVMAYNGNTRSFRVNYMGSLSISVVENPLPHLAYSIISSGSGYVIVQPYSNTYNSTSSERHWTMEFTDALSTIQVPVVQNSYGTMWMKPLELTFGSSQSFQYWPIILPSEYNVAYSIRYASDYEGSSFLSCSVGAPMSNGNLSYDERYFTVYASSNSTGFPRTATILLEAKIGTTTYWSYILPVIQESRGR